MDGLEREITTLRAELARLNDHRLFRANSTTGRVLWFQFLRGLAFGLGSVVGATVLVAGLVYFLSSIDFIPILGVWAAEIISVIEGAE